MSKESAIRAIKEIIERETKAWNNKDVDLLMTIFHHNMVWNHNMVCNAKLNN
jgi:hypothetical protein